MITFNFLVGKSLYLVSKKKNLVQLKNKYNSQEINAADKMAQKYCCAISSVKLSGYILYILVTYISNICWSCCYFFNVHVKYD